MCRMFAQVSPEPRSAAVPILRSEYSLLRQVDADASNPQADGWGIGWFDADGRPRVEKSGASAARERGRLTACVERAASTVVIAHIRAASPGIPVDDAHAHPFCDDGWIFAHNGSLTIAREVAAELGARRARLRTDSDSEVYFQQFLKHLDATGSPRAAIERCIEEDWRLWEDCRARYPGVETPYTGLNALAARPGQLHAVCHASRRGLAECGVCHPAQPWSVMSLAERAGAVWASSEGVDAGEWTAFNPPEIVSCAVSDGRVAARRQRLTPRTERGAPIPEVSRP